LRGGEMLELQRPEDFSFDDFEDTFVLVDRLKADGEIRQRLIDSLEICFRESGAAVITTAGENPQTLNYSEKFICKYDGTVYEEPEPRLFSFNSPFGACPVCQGFGNSIDIDFDLIVPNQMLSLKDGAIAPFSRPQYDWAQKELMRFARNGEIPIDVPFADLSIFRKKRFMKARAAGAACAVF
jgi:excinuclease ABC subunit A